MANESVNEETSNHMVSLEASVDPNSFKIAAKSRALAAFDRLLGTLIGIPAEYLAAVQTRVKLKGSQRTEFIKALGQKMLQLVKSDDPSVSALLERAAREEVRRQLNLYAVWYEASKTLQDSEGTDDTVADQTSSEDMEYWLDSFVDFAGRASNERIQDLLGRILAGEIKNPNTFSVSALRIVSELDQYTASAFQDVASSRLRDGSISRPGRLSGEALKRCARLEQAGLIQHATGNLVLKFELELGQHRLIETEKLALLLSSGAKEARIHLPIMSLTHVGQELATLLPLDQEKTLRELASHVHHDVGVSIVKVTGGRDLEISYNIVEEIRSAPTT